MSVMLNTAIATATNLLQSVSKSPFANTANTAAIAGASTAVIVLALVLLVLYVLVLLLVGKWLFNNILCSLFSGVKPATSVWQILGLWFLLHLLLP